MKQLRDLFEDKNAIIKIKEKLPDLFHLAELESSRAGKIGMEVGVVRERIIVAMLINFLGEEVVETEIATTEAEVDVIIYKKPVSIKTITGYLTGVKLIWTVDWDKAKEFQQEYEPSCDMIFVQIVWGKTGGIYLFSQKSQKEILDSIGRDKYIRLPPRGTNPRGVEISTEALKNLTEHKSTKLIEIEWIKKDIDFNPYKRWLDYWRE
jgi:hypothetical protein